MHFWQALKTKFNADIKILPLLNSILWYHLFFQKDFYIKLSCISECYLCKYKMLVNN